MLVGVKGESQEGNAVPLKEDHGLEKAIQRLDDVIHVYKRSLDYYTIEQLRHKLSDHRWSLGEMYDHVINSALHTYFPAIIKCLNEPDTHATAKTAAGDEIFTMGAYPPTKVKSSARPPKNPETKEPLYDGLHRIIEQARVMLPVVIEARPDAKVMHSRLGALNAKEWFQLADMHFRHHLIQKEELEQAQGIVDL